LLRYGGLFEVVFRLMKPVSYKWQADGSEQQLELVHVPGTNGKPFMFGREPNRRPIEVPDFYISTTPVTQALWMHVMGSNPAADPNMLRPVENITWDQGNSFADRLNSSEIRAKVLDDQPQMVFRLPSETEWEYAARGGPRWTDNFTYSGSNDVRKVAWYGPHWTKAHDLIAGLLGPRRGWHILGRPRFKRPTGTHDVATKAPNQLGIYDMSGNVWEWCQDICIDDLNAVPADGSPYLGQGEERRLRGGCHHNWNLHCTVSWRYGIDPDAHDGCIGLRLVLGKEFSNS
jgi:formylglycine-generating enzyme required for sulfatase activity